MATSNPVEEMRPWITSLVISSIGMQRLDIVDTSIKSLYGDLKRKDAIEQLKPLIRDDSVTLKFVDSLYKKFQEVKTAHFQKSLGAAVKRSSEAVADGAPGSKLRKSRFEQDGSTSEDILTNTMKMLEDRKRTVAALAAQQGMSLEQTDEKSKKAAELQARIQATLSAKPGLLSNVLQRVPGKPTPLLLDAEGRTIDKSGKKVPIPQRRPDLMANVKAMKKEHFEKASKKVTESAKDEDSPFYDQRLKPMMGQRNVRSFKFNEPGKFVKVAQAMRAKAQLEKLQSEIESTAKKTGISAATKLALITPNIDTVQSFVTEVEWWDSLILATGRYPNTESLTEGDFKGIGKLIEHPIPVYPSGEPNKPLSMQIYLTAEERKKLRKQRRREAELEKQEKIQLGLAEKPETKVKISNLMRVLKTEAVQDPTKVEAHVRAQMEERKRKHEETNLSRKLTKKQKRAKSIRKLTEDTSTGVHINVFRVHDLSNPSIKFKVDTNAQQLHLTGCLILNKELNLVVVEGGPKCLKKYRNLLLKRIKWAIDKKGHSTEKEGDEDRKTHKEYCQLVWEGTRQTRSFYNWSIKACKGEQQARDHLKKYSAEFYWDLALSQTIVEEED